MSVSSKLVATCTAEAFDSECKTDVLKNREVLVANDPLNQRAALVRVQVFAGREVSVRTNPGSGRDDLGGVRGAGE